MGSHQLKVSGAEAGDWWLSPGDRSPNADLRVGDMHALPWQDTAFTVVTSFLGIWGTTPDAVGRPDDIYHAPARGDRQ
jgi:hypothetical protein